MNPLYQKMNKGGGNDFMSRFKQFKSMFKGNPQEQIQQMLNSGKITQDQYNDAVQKAQQMIKLFKM